MDFEPVLRWGLWLLAPVILWNLFLARRLPAAYQAPGRDRIPQVLDWGEKLFRVLIFLPLALVQMDPRGFLGPGVIYLAGLGVYFLSWVLVMKSSRWRSGAFGFSAPAWSSGLWLVPGYLRCPQTLWGWEVPFLVPGVWILGFLGFHTAHSLWIFYRGEEGAS